MTRELSTTCCIAGGGPAGMMAGFLLARAGIDVIVLEKHADFFRDFRGDTIHPSTFNIMNEIGLLDDFLKVKHDEQNEVGFAAGGKIYRVADFSHLPVAHQVLGFMPQWDFLNFMLKNANNYPSFKIMFNTEATSVLREGYTITGVEAKNGNQQITIHSKLVIAADGRKSIIRDSGGLIPVELGAPMDVLWFRLSKHAGDPALPLLHLNTDNIFISINRDTYYQCGYVIAKGSFENLKADGLQNFRNKLTAILPFAKDRMVEIKNWNDVSLLSVSVNRLRKWYLNGLLCIGDSAHAMSPVGGVGINLAIQDAVAAANILYEPLRDNKLTTAHLEKIQRRRMLPTIVIQKLQLVIQNKFINPTVNRGNKKTQVPFFVKILQHSALLRRIPAWLIGMGIRMEHVKTPAQSAIKGSN